jgi:hypothetical protein
VVQAVLAAQELKMRNFWDLIKLCFVIMTVIMACALSVGMTHTIFIWFGVL